MLTTPPNVLDAICCMFGTCWESMGTRGPTPGSGATLCSTFTCVIVAAATGASIGERIVAALALSTSIIQFLL